MELVTTGYRDAIWYRNLRSTLKGVFVFLFSIFSIIGLLLVVVMVVIVSKKQSKIPDVAAASLHQVVASNDQDIRLFVLGDMGSNKEPQKRVSAAMESRCQQFRPEALIFLGDNIYDNGVESTTDPAWQTQLLQFYQSPCLRNIPIYAALGNHDYLGNSQAQIDYTLIDSRWNMPFRFYDVRFGEVLSLTVIDTWYPNYCLGLKSNCTVDFLFDSLQQNNDAAWQLVAGHHPAYASSAQSSNHGGGVRGVLLEEVLCTKNVSAYLAGHAHHLEYSISQLCDMDLIISGAGGGSSLYKIQDELNMNNRFLQSTYGYTEIFADRNSISYQFFDWNGQHLHTSQRHK